MPFVSLFICYCHRVVKVAQAGFYSEWELKVHPKKETVVLISGQLLSCSDLQMIHT